MGGAESRNAPCGVHRLSAYAVYLAHAAEVIGTETKIIVSYAGQDLVEAHAPGADRSMLTEAAPLRALLDSRSNVASDRPRLVAKAVALPLIPSDVSVPVFCWPTRTPEPQQIMVQYDPSVAQVVLFIPRRGGLSKYRAHVYMTEAGSQVFRDWSFSFNGRSHAVPPRRDGMEFFTIAEAMWNAAQSSDVEAFEKAAGSFSETDVFECDGFARDHVFSGRQLATMRSLLRERLSPSAETRTRPPRPPS